MVVLELYGQIRCSEKTSDAPRRTARSCPSVSILTSVMWSSPALRHRRPASSRPRPRSRRRSLALAARAASWFPRLARLVQTRLSRPVAKGYRHVLTGCPSSASVAARMCMRTARMRTGRDRRAVQLGWLRQAWRLTNGRHWRLHQERAIADPSAEFENPSLQRQFAVGARVIWDVRPGAAEHEPGGAHHGRRPTARHARSVVAVAARRRADITSPLASRRGSRVY